MTSMTSMASSTSYTDADIQDYIDYTDAVIAETYPKIKKAVSPHAATRMKQDLVRLRKYTLDRINKLRNPDQQCETHSEELYLDEEICLEDSKVMFSAIAYAHCDAAIEAQLRFSNKAFRATLTREVILEKCKICGLEEPHVKQILDQAGFDENDDCSSSLTPNEDR